MFRSSAVRTVFLISLGTIAGLPLSAPAADGGPAIPAPADQSANTPPASKAKKPAVNTPAKPSKKVADSPAQPVPPGTVIAPLDSGADAIPPAPSSNGPVFPGLGQFLRPDGGIDLPGGVGTIHRTPEQIGIQINTPDGPLEINIPRRQRAAEGVDEAPGAEGEAPPPGGRAGLNSGRASREFTLASRIFRARNYPATLRRLNRYLTRDAGDRDLLQLRSLTNFALSDYSAAYRDALTAMGDADAWDWTTVSSLYRSAGDYTAQYRALEDYVTANPNSSEAAFLLAYQNLMLGHQETARRGFGRVAAIDPANDTARRLATGERPPQPGRQSPTPRGAGAKTGPATSTAPASPRGTTPQGTTGGGPSVDLGQPAPPPK